MAWKISSSNTDFAQLLVDESLFFTGNGYLGVRGNFEEGLPHEHKTIRGTYINAFHDTVKIPYGEKLFAFPDTQQKLLNVINSQTIDIFFDDEHFSMAEGKILSFERHLHLDKGFAERVVEWRSPSGKTIKINFKRMVSFLHKEVFIQKLKIESPDQIGVVRIISTVNGDVSNYVDSSDPRVASGHAKLLFPTKVQQIDNTSYVECETTNTKLQTACAASHYTDAAHTKTDTITPVSITSEFACSFNGKLEFEKKSIYVDTLRHGENLIISALDLQNKLSKKNFLSLLDDQIVFLEKYWSKSDILIHGDEALQEGIRFNLFHLLQSTGTDSFSNIAAKGLSGEGYEGHFFWDTEIYIFPVFLMTHPEIAKQLLLYRYSILDLARDRAKEMGHRQGALFPWRTISGTECSSYFPSGSAQYHISADIAYSFIQYYLVTYDQQFMEKFGAEVLFETARLWLDTGHFDGGTFRIDAVTGPDEYTCIVNNNYYTNAMAKHNLEWAAKIYDLLNETSQEQFLLLTKKIGLQAMEVEDWKNAAEQMYLPFNEMLTINPQDDSFLQKGVWDFASTPKNHYPLLLHYHPLTLYRYQVCKQADTVLAHFLLEDNETIETIRHSYEYYESITTHDSSLSTCIFSIMASKLGYKQKAYEYFIETARLDLDNTHKNTKDGLHMANMGGTWLAIVFGFAGLRIKETGLSFSPILPEKWEGYSFSIQYNGRVIQIEKTNTHTALKLVNGEELSVQVFNQRYQLSEDIVLST